MRVLSLFSGGGLGDFGLMLAGMEIVGQVEIDDYCQKILKLRWPDVPKWRDIKNVKGKEVLERCGRIDLVSGGFPCQPFSTAGRRTGKDDKRHLWPEMLRVIREVRPRWVLAENVPGLLSISGGRVFGGVVRDLAESGYRVEWDCIPASALGAHHQRDRVWIVGYSTCLRRRKGKPISKCKKRETKFDVDGTGQVLADAPKPSWNWQAQRQQQGAVRGRGSQPIAICNPAIERLPDWSGGQVGQPSPLTEFERPSGREIERDFRGISHGVTNRVDRLKCLGNGQVTFVVKWIGRRIMEFNNV